jgi:flagellar basal-body rod modification protein FlgD
VMFQSPGLASVTLEVYDVSGRLVKSQELGAVSEGQQTILWDGSSSNGETLSNGVYIIRLAGGSERSATARVILLR